MQRSDAPATLRGLVAWFVLLAGELVAPSAVLADEPDSGIYLVRRVHDLKFAGGTLEDLVEPAAPVDQPRDRPADLWLAGMVDLSVWIDGEGELFLDRPELAGGGPFNPGFSEVEPDDVVVIRLPKPRAGVTGHLVGPRPGRPAGTDPVRLAFTLDGAKSDAGAAERFRRAKVQHYVRLLMRGGPGTAWYGHQIRASNPGGAVPPILNGFATRRGPDDTYALLSGGRALSENLQLDRVLIERPGGNAPAAADAKPVRLDTIPGITVAEIDWTARLAGKTPALDPLAKLIPADQHALFVPDLKAAGTLLALERRWGGLPLLALAASSGEDQGVVARYEQQLGLARADLATLAERGLVSGLALTGSDPYFADGTDVAVLLQTDQPDALLAWVRERIAAIPDAEAIEGTVADDVRWTGKRSAQGRVRTHAAALDGAVVVTNSLTQLSGIAAAARGKSPALATAPEYRFFRDRYPRGAAGEAALLVLTDATIRRWCGPKWRIAQSRRLRAAGALAEAQAASLDAVVQSAGRPEGLKSPETDVDLGELTWGPGGVGSTIYGLPGALTPIAELPMETVTPIEAAAYGRWRDTYQSNWRGVFDPIAVRISESGGTLGADVTVMPLIVGSSYRELIGIIGDAKIAAGAGDPHPEAVLHAVLAVDPKSQLLRQGDQSFRQMTQAPARVGLTWIGPTVAAYADEDPFWAELAGAEDLNAFLNREWTRLPVGVHVDSGNPVTMALFLTSLRAFAQQSAPDTLTWTTLPHGEKSYVRISAPAGAVPTPRPLNLYYATTPRGLMITLSEPMVQRFLDRQAAPAPVAGAGSAWLGESLAARATPAALERIGGLSRRSVRERLRSQSWANLAILNEWRRLYPDRDPVAVHREVWGVTLVCPGGGSYVWNDTWHTMESTAFGHPGAPKPGPELPQALTGLAGARFGITLGDGGLRGRVELDPAPSPAAAPEAAPAAKP